MNSKTQVLLVSLCGALLILGLVAGLRAQAADVAGSILYVQPGGSGNCTSWADACTLQAALDTTVAGDEIWVAAGIHTPTLQSTPGVTRTATFQLKSGVAIYGGFAATETLRSERDWETNVTVLSGDIDGNDITDSDGALRTTAHISGTNSYHVVTGSGVTETAALDGLTITGGSADGAWPDNQGGGMVNDSGGPTVANVTFRGNLATSGGGMYNGNSSSPTLSGMHFISNTADYGAGMYNASNSSLTLSGTQFISNTARLTGGGMYNSGSDLMLTDVDFIGNTATNEGGGMHNETSDLTATHVTFISNIVTASFCRGGGMYNSGSSPTLTDVTFRGNSAVAGSCSGGGMYTINSSPTLSSVTFSSNTAAYEGGGMCTDNSTPTLSDVTFSGNTASEGGGMWNEGSTLMLTDVAFSGNTADQVGGGMTNHTSNLTATHVTVISNTAGSRGGGMYDEGSDVTLTDVTFISNTAVSEGGGMWNWGSSLTLTRTQFITNTAGSEGGGMYNDFNTLTLTDIAFSGNTAQLFGGGMYNKSSTLTLTDVAFSGNTTYSSGGGMYNRSSTLTLTDVAFSGNTALVDAAAGGGGMFNWYSNLMLTDVDFISNTADYSGGGMCNYGGSLTLRDVAFSDNATESGGGGMHSTVSSLTLTGTQFISNTAGSQGGGMYNESSTLTLTDIAFSGNTAGSQGGGMYNFPGTNLAATHVTFISNTAGSEGGGMYNGYSNLMLTDVAFSGNTAESGGGGMHNTLSSLTLTGTQFISNTAGSEGGGMWSWGGALTLADVTFITNTAIISGGGMYNGSSSPRLVFVTFDDNSATSGGGMYNRDDSSPTLSYFTFSRNQANEHGGGIYNQDSNPTLAIGTFNGNQADADSDNAGNGGGMYNLGSSPALINVTFSSNSASYGGGMVNDTAAALSLPELKNTILWGNTATNGSPQIHDLAGSQAIGASCMVEGGYTGCFISDATFPFVDADGTDNIPGTADDDLHLAYTSNGIDAGTNGLLPQDGNDLDGDNDTTEKLPFDLGGNPRCFADEDLDGVVDADLNPCEINTVDLGAYEAQCFAWDMRYGYDKLEQGQLYRTGFHAETTMTSTVTIADTLASYAAEVAAGNLTRAKQAFKTALGCAATVTETDQAVAGLQQAIWELATGAMLQGNEKMVQALDVTAAGGVGGINADIDQLTQAIGLYSQAVDGYLEPLADDLPGFLAGLQSEREPPITSTAELTPTHVDLQRLAMAAAKKSRAYLELTERYFRIGDEAQAKQALHEGLGEAMVELTLLYALWPEVADDVNYVAVVRDMADMDRLYGYLMEDKNPFGYGPKFVPFHYRPQEEDERGHNNYLQTKWLADLYLDWAKSAVMEAAGQQQKIDDNYQQYQATLWETHETYNGQLAELCGTNASQEPDMDRCAGGTIQAQTEAVRGAALRIEEVLQRMENQNQLIRIEQERVAQVVGIRRATAQLISDTGEELASLAAQEAMLRYSKTQAQGVLGIVNGIVTGGFGGASAVGEAKAAPGLAFGMAGLGGLWGGLNAFADWKLQEQVAEDLADVYSQKERLYAKQQAAVQYAEGQIAEADSLALQRRYFLEFAELQIEYAIALNNLLQELARLNGAVTQAQYLLAEKAKAQAFTALLYQDPAGRVLRNHMMEQAHYDFERALEQAYRAGRALEYEINQDVLFAGEPLSNLDDIYAVNNTSALEDALHQTTTAWEDWNARTDIPIPEERMDIVYLSEAVGFEDVYDPDLDRIVTKREQFNAFVRDPVNRVDRDDDGVPESLRFSFQTSILKGNKFFPWRFFNDKTDSIKMRVRGADLALGSQEPLWVDITLTQAGTSFIRTENSTVHTVGGSDDVREYNLHPLVANIQAAVNDNPFPETAENRELATRSVAFTNWTLEIDVTQGGQNRFLNLDNVDEIELIIIHTRYSLQELAGLSVQGVPDLLEPPLSRGDQPAALTLPPFSLTRSPLEPEREIRTAQTGAIDINDTYVGTVIISRPLYLSPMDLIMVLTDTQGTLSGYVSPTLSYPVTDQGAYPGPAVSGSWSGDSFNMQSELFTTTIAAGIPITRQVFLHTGVISDSGEILTGVYSETLAGLTPEPLEFMGEFWLVRPAHVLTAAFTAHPVAGDCALEVNFTDLSLGAPTTWAWSFGDGATSSEQNPSHTYTQVGSYTVTLTISNTFGLDTKSETDCIMVKQPAVYLPLVLKGSP